MTTLRWPDNRARRLRVAGAALLVLTLAAGSAAHELLDGREWASASPHARFLAQDPDATTRERREAIVVLLRDVRASIAALAVMRDKSDVADQARIALASIANEIPK